MTLLRIASTLSFFSVDEIGILLIGRLFKSFRSPQYYILQEKKNKIDFLYIQRIRTLEVESNLLHINYSVFKRNLKTSIRIKGSDVFVFKQILIDGEFKFILELFTKTFGYKPKIIVDAGSNIGCTMLSFLAYNGECKVLAIEPSTSNIELSIKNVSQNQFSSNVIFVQKALWPKKCLLSISDQFRDGTDWSLAAIPSDKGEIESMAPVDTFEYLHTEVIDLFKIDIEGGEAELFKLDSDLGWLFCVKMITIEIHHEFDAETKIISCLNEYGFRIIKHGELTIGVNTKYVNATHE